MLQLVIVALVLLMIVAPQYKHWALIGIVIALATGEKNKPGTNAFYEDFADNYTKCVISDNKLAKALAYTLTSKGNYLDHFNEIVREVSAEDFIQAMHTKIVFEFYLYGTGEFYPMELLIWDMGEQTAQYNEAYGYEDAKDMEEKLKSYQDRMFHFFEVYFAKLKETGMTPITGGEALGGHDDLHKILTQAYNNVQKMVIGGPKTWQMQNLTSNPFERVMAMYEDYRSNPGRTAKRGRDDEEEDDFDSMLEDITTDVSKKMRLG